VFSYRYFEWHRIAIIWIRRSFKRNTTIRHADPRSTPSASSVARGPLPILAQPYCHADAFRTRHSVWTLIEKIVGAVTVPEIIELPGFLGTKPGPDFVLINEHFNGSQVPSEVAGIGIGLHEFVGDQFSMHDPHHGPVAQSHDENCVYIMAISQRRG
jgi:hypothetical protein